MNFRYLWVDALCIIQNDERLVDWYEESGRMCDIYSNAHFVIAADSAPSCTTGFLDRLGFDTSGPDWEELPLMKKTTIWTQKATSPVIPGVVVNLKRKGHYFCLRPERSDPNVITTSPLSQRGWTFQENILPCRILHFTEGQVIWECNTEVISEFDFSAFLLPKSQANMAVASPSTAVPPPPPPLSRWHSSQENISRTHITDFVATDKSGAVYWAWQRLVEHYSGRKLSFQRDKLAAMSGLAQLVCTRNNVQHADYLAGLWRGQLVRDLLWTVCGPQCPRRQPPSTENDYHYLAPSWSWASVDSGVRYFAEHYQFNFSQEIAILEVECSPLSPLDPTGRVTAGHMIVAGRVWRGQLHIMTPAGNLQPLHSMYCGYNGHAGRFWESVRTEFRPLSELASREPKPEREELEFLMDVEVGPEDQGRKCFRLNVGAYYDKVGPQVRVWFLVLKEILEANEDGVGGHGGDSDSDSDGEGKTFYRTFERIGAGYYHTTANSEIGLLSDKERDPDIIRLV